MIPLPSKNIQEEVVSKINSAFLQIEQTLVEVCNARTLLTSTDQSILAKAFRGELVDQDPNDEPASALLDRIRAEREKIESKGKKGQRKGKKATQEAEAQMELPGME